MKYQVVKHNKTGSRTLALYDTLAEARSRVEVEANGARYEGRTYVGGFPHWTDSKGKVYSIQGAVEMGASYVVCSLDEKEAQGITK